MFVHLSYFLKDFKGFLSTKEGFAELQENIIHKTIKHCVARCLGHFAM